MNPVDPALVDQGWWIVRVIDHDSDVRGAQTKIVVAKVERDKDIDESEPEVWVMGRDYASGTPVRFCAGEWAIFLRKLDLEKLAAGES